MASVTFPRIQTGTPPHSDQRNAYTVSFSTIKCFDFPEIEAAGFDRFNKIEDFCRALKADGFAAIKMPPEMKALFKEAYNVLELYFEQQLGVKERDNFQDLGLSGYVPKGETGLSEKFLFPPGFSRYPTNNPDFERAIEAYRTSLSGLSAQIFEYISLFLKEPLEERGTMESGANNTLEAIHYPPVNHIPPHDAVRFASQGDQSALTLMPSGSGPGLELKQNGSWKPVIVPEGYMIVNSGRQLWRKTAGEFPEANYRVAYPGGEAINGKRLDMVFFASWSPDYNVAPLDSCIKRVTADMANVQKDDFFKQFRSVTVKQSRDARLIEIGVVTDPPKEELEKLVKLGLILEPPKALATKYPDLFPNFINWEALDDVEF